MDVDKILNVICNVKELIVTILGFIVRRITGEKSNDKSNTYVVGSKMYDNNNASDGNIITGNKNQVIQYDNSNTIPVEGNCNVVSGNGNWRPFQVLCKLKKLT